MKVVSIVGMPGAGKSVVTALFRDHDFVPIRFGDITDEEVIKRGLPLNEENERKVREQIRKEYGMAAYALLNIPKIENTLRSSNVIVDGLYSWEEYTCLKDTFGEKLLVVAVWASPTTRYSRLAEREIRPLTADESSSRDYAEIEKLNKGAPIAMADFTIVNESSIDDVKQQVDKFISGIS